MPRPKKYNGKTRENLTTTLDFQVKKEIQRYCFENNLYIGELIEIMFADLKKQEEKAKKRAERKAKKDTSAKGA